MPEPVVEQLADQRRCGRARSPARRRRRPAAARAAPAPRRAAATRPGKPTRASTQASGVPSSRHRTTVTAEASTVSHRAVADGRGRELLARSRPTGCPRPGSTSGTTRNRAPSAAGMTSSSGGRPSRAPDWLTGSLWAIPRVRMGPMRSVGRGERAAGPLPAVAGGHGRRPLVTLLVILGLRGLPGAQPSDLEVKPEQVDYLAQVRFAQQDAGCRPGLSRAACRGLVRHERRLLRRGSRPTLGLSMLTADDEYVGFASRRPSAPELLTTYVDPHPTRGCAGDARRLGRHGAGTPGPTPAATPRSSRAWHDEIADGLRHRRRRRELETLAGVADRPVAG